MGIDTRISEELSMKKKKLSLIIIASLMSLSIFAGCNASSPKQAMETTMAGRSAEFYSNDGATEWESNGAKSASLGPSFKRSNSEAVAEATDDGSSSAPQAANSNANSNADQSQTNVDPTKGRLLIRNVQIVAETKNFESVRVAIEDKVKAIGGYIENSGVSGTGKTGNLRKASYKIRVPAESLDALISEVGSNCTITSTNERTQDVTLSYVDTKARLDSLRVEQKQLTELLNQAKDLDSIIVLQDRLTQVRYQIESAESTLRVLENQVTYATLSLNIREVVEIKPQEEPHVDTYGETIVKTFKNSLKAIAEFFKGLFLVIVALSPLLVAMIITAVIVLAIVFGARKKRRARVAAAKAAAAQAAEAQAKPEVKTEEKKAEKE